MTRDAYDAYRCTKCDGRGVYRNETQNLADQRGEVPCFCAPYGRVLVLRGFKPPWYAGERTPQYDLESAS